MAMLQRLTRKIDQSNADAGGLESQTQMGTRHLT